MALESGTYISDLNPLNPAATDPKSQGDDHLRLLKATLKATFPNVTGAVTATHAELSLLAGLGSAPVESTGGTASGLTLSGGYTEQVFAVTGATPALSPDNGSTQTWTLMANSAPTAGEWSNGQSMDIFVDDGAGFVADWLSVPVVWKTDGGLAPVLLTTGYTPIVLRKLDGVIYGFRAGDA